MHPAAAAVIHTWPADRPLAILCNGAGPDAHTLLVEPTRTFRLDDARSGVWLDPLTGEVVGALAASSDEPLAILDTLTAIREPRQGEGWIGYLSYDLGRAIEPSVDASPLANPRAVDDRGWPLAVFRRYVARASCPCPASFESSNDSPPLPFTLAPLTSIDAPDYHHAVRAALEYIRAGDIFQVNLAHRLSAAFRGSARAAFAALAVAARPWHGAYIEFPDAPGRSSALLSISPELFLKFDLRTGAVSTRPMKGTRPAHANPHELERSEKDRAELNMILDLMRNDLGRVAQLRSVHLTAERTIERHDSGVLQATGTVEASLRPGARLSDILRAAFPPGSVTGAPKIRAMQIIDELEPVRRGPYCGAIAHLPDAAPATLSVAIRTACIRGRSTSPGTFTDATLDYSIGAGIVADSDLHAEWQETLDKARILRVLTGSAVNPPARATAHAPALP